MGTGEKWFERGLLAVAVGFGVLGFGWLAPSTQSFRLGPRDSAGLRVLTWNVGNKSGKPMSDDSLSGVAETLRQADADLVFLQEVSSHRQFDLLLTRLGDGWRGSMPSGWNHGIAVFCQRGRLRASVVKTGFIRRAVSVLFKQRGRSSIAAVVVHADAFSAKRRNVEIGRAADHLLRDSRARVKLFAGDLNLDLDLDKRRDLFTNEEHLDVESYNYVAQELFDVGIGRGATAQPDRRLDYLFINAELSVKDAGPWKDRRTGDMDHHPLVADLEFVNH